MTPYFLAYLEAFGIILGGLYIICTPQFFLTFQDSYVEHSYVFGGRYGIGSELKDMIAQGCICRTWYSRAMRLQSSIYCCRHVVL